MEKSIEELVHDISTVKSGNKELLQELQAKLKELDLRTFFTQEERKFGLALTGAVAWYNEEWITITPEEYLDALRELLIQKLAWARESESDLKELIRRFTKKQAGYRDLKDAIE